MKRFLSFILFSFLISNVVAQISPSLRDSIANSNYNLEDVDASEIPDESVLRSLGMTEEQIKAALEIKKAKEKEALAKSASNNNLIKSGPINKPDSIGDKMAKDNLPMDTLDKSKLPASVIYGQDIFRNNRISFYEKAKDVIAPESYVLGPSDEISISVWGFSDYNENFRISEDGYITSKLIGRVYLKGLTFKNARSLMQRKLSGVLDLDRSEFDMALSYSRVISINIVGEVYNPGSYTIPAVNTAFNALVVVGGPTDIGSVRNVFIRRNGINIDTLDVYDFMMNPADYPQTYLQDNDYVIVPVASRVVKVSGEVRRPFKFELDQGENLLKVLDFAGGFKAEAYKSRVQVRRYGIKEEFLIDVDVDSLKEISGLFPLNDGDEVLVRRIPQGYVNNVTATGAVRIPGDYQIRKGDRVSDLLVKTEGVKIRAYTDRAFIIRLNDDMTKEYMAIDLRDVLTNPASPDNIELKEFDELKVLSKVDFEDDFVVSTHGAVRKEGEFRYGIGLSLKDVLFMSGGLRKEAANKRIEISRVVDYDKQSSELTPIRAIVKTVEVANDLSINKEDQEYLLQPFDQIFVRTNPDFEPPALVHLDGEVLYPGKYSILRKDEKISDLIIRAGGFKEYAFLDGVSMYREGVGRVYFDIEKAMRKPDSKHNVVVNEGDSIVIPKTLDLVYISGAIANHTDHSISAPYFGKRAKYYITKFAGGFNSESARGKTYVIYPNGVIRKTASFGLFRIYPKVKQGSEIMVMSKPPKPDKAERKPVDWNRVIESTTIKITGILTLWLLIDRVVAANQ